MEWFEDALIINMSMANYNCKGVLVNTGSLVDIPYKDTFDRIGLSTGYLWPINTPLYGFAREKVDELGQLCY